MGDNRYLFVYKQEEINSALKRAIIFRSIIIAIFFGIMALIYFRVTSQLKILALVVLAYAVYYVYLMMLYALDIKISKEKLPIYKGTIVYTKAGFYRPITIKTDAGTRFRMFTDQNILNVGDKVEAQCTRKSRFIVSCKYIK